MAKRSRKKSSFASGVKAGPLRKKNSCSSKKLKLKVPMKALVVGPLVEELILQLPYVLMKNIAIHKRGLP